VGREAGLDCRFILIKFEEFYDKVYGKALDGGLISLKFEFFFTKRPGKSTICTIRLADPTAGNGPRRGHAGWRSFRRRRAAARASSSSPSSFRD
jgi:hypothetical protein